jgi:hypothetical protein
MTNTFTAVIITHEEGSGGREIARQLAESLHYTYVDEQVIRLATENMSATEVEWFIRETTRRHKVVIVSCGASHILKEWPEKINIFIRSPMSQGTYAAGCLKHHDRKAAYLSDTGSTRQGVTYVSHLSRSVRTNPDLYDLVINTELIPLNAVVATLCQYVQALERPAIGHSWFFHSYPG